MSIFKVIILKNCQRDLHQSCINLSKRCECDCHEDKNKPRDIHPLQNVKIIPQTYCSKCIHNYDVELDFCKTCGRHLIRFPNYSPFKTRFAHCMGELDYFLWDKKKREDYEERKRKEGEFNDNWYYLSVPSSRQQPGEPTKTTKPKSSSSWKFWKKYADIDYQ